MMNAPRYSGTLRAGHSDNPLTSDRAAPYDSDVGYVFHSCWSPSMPVIAAILRLNLSLGLSLIGRAGRWS